MYVYNPTTCYLTTCENISYKYPGLRGPSEPGEQRLVLNPYELPAQESGQL